MYQSMQSQKGSIMGNGRSFDHNHKEITLSNSRVGDDIMLNHVKFPTIKGSSIIEELWSRFSISPKNQR